MRSDQDLERARAALIELAQRHAPRRPAQAPSPDTDLRAELRYDSLALIDFAVAIEERFGIELPPEQTMHVRTVGDAQRLLERLLTGSGGDER